MASLSGSRHGSFRHQICSSHLATLVGRHQGDQPQQQQQQQRRPQHVCAPVRILFFFFYIFTCKQPKPPNHLYLYFFFTFSHFFLLCSFLLPQMGVCAGEIVERNDIGSRGKRAALEQREPTHDWVRISRHDCQERRGAVQFASPLERHHAPWKHGTIGG